MELYKSNPQKVFQYSVNLFVTSPKRLSTVEVWKEMLKQFNLRFAGFKADNTYIPEAITVVRCKDCKYFGEADSDEPEYHECNYFSDWSTVHYMLENDYCSCAERKGKAEE